MARKPDILDTQPLRRALKRLHPDLDVDAIVDELMLGQSSARAIPEMSVARLSQHFPPRTAELLHLIPGIARSTLRNRYPARPQIACLDDACRFLYGHFMGQRYERCYLLLLRKSKYLIRDLLIQTGTLDTVPFYTRNIVEAVMNYEADALVVAHNHPGGTTAPSAADINCTATLIAALAPISVPLLDHIIIAGTTAVSIRQSSNIDESVWLAQPNFCPSYLRNWAQPPKKKPDAKKRSAAN